MGERSGFGSGSSVDRRTISAALWLGSFGSGLLERLMHALWAGLWRNARAGGFKL